MKNYKNTDYLERIKAIEKRLDKLEGKVPIAKHEFKVGDRVQFKTWEEMEREFGKAEHGEICIEDLYYFDKDLRHLCGTYATITDIFVSGQVFLKDFTAKGDTFWTYHIGMLKPAVNEPKWTFTDDEKAILRNMPKKYKWIARDCCGGLFLYSDKPPRGDFVWICYNHIHIEVLDCFKHLFKCIKWEDAEPCEFRKYL